MIQSGSNLLVSNGAPFAIPTALSNYRRLLLATFGDSRATPNDSIVGTPGMNDKQLREIKLSYTNQSHMSGIGYTVPDSELVCDGGCSGTEASSWDSGARNKTLAEINAITWDVIVIQYGTNDIQNNVTNAATRDSIDLRVQGDSQEMINYFLGLGKKVVWETILQRSDSTGANCYSTNTVVKRDCCDQINTAMIAWIQAHASYNTTLRLSDLRAATNVGGATTGAYLETTNGYSTDGCHLTWLANMEIARITAVQVRAFSPARIQQAMISASTTNLITGVSASSIFVPAGTNCTAGARTYGTDSNGFPYVESTITVTGANASINFQCAADVGSNGGRTPPNTISVGDVLTARAMLTVDDGSGGFSNKVWNIYCNLVATYIGGVPATQSCRNGVAANGTTVMTGTMVDAAHQVWGEILTGDSSLIGAPAASSGLYYQIRFYATTGTGTYRIRITNPEIRKML